MIDKDTSIIIRKGAAQRRVVYNVETKFTVQNKLGSIDDVIVGRQVGIPAKPITDSDLMAITIPSDAERRRSEATLSCSYHAAVIGISQLFCC